MDMFAALSLKSPRGAQKDENSGDDQPIREKQFKIMSINEVELNGEK